MPCLESTRCAPTRVAELPLAPESSLTRRACLTAVASFLDYSAKIGVSLFLTPFLVDGLGRSLFGVWEVLVRLVGYLSIADGRPTDGGFDMMSAFFHDVPTGGGGRGDSAEGTRSVRYPFKEPAEEWFASSTCPRLSVFHTRPH